MRIEEESVVGLLLQPVVLRVAVSFRELNGDRSRKLGTEAKIWGKADLTSLHATPTPSPVYTSSAKEELLTMCNDHDITTLTIMASKVGCHCH